MRQEDGKERVTAQKSSPTLSGRQLQARGSDLTAFNISEMLSMRTCRQTLHVSV